MSEQDAVTPESEVWDTGQILEAAATVTDPDPGAFGIDDIPGEILDEMSQLTQPVSGEEEAE